jgi:RNA-directed DNA polymerase
VEDAIRKAIEQQSRKLIERQRARQVAAARHRERFESRTGETAKVVAEKMPAIWAVHPHFDPFYCIKHSKYLAATIWKKIRSREYKVTPAVLFQIPKNSGGFRSIASFSIPDTAIANIFNRKLRERNKNIQSPYCYAYREDRNLFDAVIQTSSLVSADKTYIIKYDFKDYFDSISHDYLRFVMERGEFFISAVEKFVINKFIKHEFAAIKDYQKCHDRESFKRRRKGVPQGCSLSLFLANIAAHELDKNLERANGSFVRYADDIVCVAHTLDDAFLITQTIKNHCYYSGININSDKSPGICLLKSTLTNIEERRIAYKGSIEEIKFIPSFDYLGHTFTQDSIRISDAAIRRIKTRVARIIYIHLLQNPRRNLFDPSRVGSGFYDWDLVTCLNELRKFIYGGLSEAALIGFIEANLSISRFRGLMAFYPLVNRVDEFAALDGWLVSVIRRANRERIRVLKTNFDIDVSPLTSRQLLDGIWYDFNEIELETLMPSFVLAWRAARKGFKQSGSATFETPSYYSWFSGTEPDVGYFQ